MEPQEESSEELDIGEEFEEEPGINTPPVIPLMNVSSPLHTGSSNMPKAIGVRAGNLKFHVRQRSADYGLDRKSIFERMHKEAKEKDMALKELIAEALAQEMEPCTFQPLISVQRGSREFNEFLREQYERAEKRESEIRILREEQKIKELSQRQPSPTISPVITASRVLAATRQDNRRVYDRLHNASKCDCKKSTDSINFSFRPEINESPKKLKRPPITQCNLLRSKPKNSPLEPLNKVKRFDRFLNDKVMKELSSTLKNYRGKILTFYEFAGVLNSLQLADVKRDEELVKEIWDILKGDVKGEVPKQALEAFLLAIMVPRRSTSVDLRDSKTFTKLDTIGVYIETDKGTIYKLNEQEKEYLYKKYAKRMHCNRLSKNTSRSTSRDRLADQSEFSPRINPRSNQMANAARYKILGKVAESNTRKTALSSSSISELLLYHQVLYERRRQLKYKEKEQQRVKECTFKPITNESPRTGKIPISVPVSPSVCQNKRMEALIMSQQEPNFTFKPAINKHKVQSTKQVVIKGKDKSVDRLRKGWEDRERVKKMTQRGEINLHKPIRKKVTHEIPNKYDRLKQKIGRFLDNRKYTQKRGKSPDIQSKTPAIIISQPHSSIEEEAEPPLCIEVMITTGRKEKVVLSDFDSLGQLIEHLRGKYGMDAAQQQRVTQQIIDQIKEYIEINTEST